MAHFEGTALEWGSRNLTSGSINRVCLLPDTISADFTIHYVFGRVSLWTGLGYAATIYILRENGLNYDLIATFETATTVDVAAARYIGLRLAGAPTAVLAGDRIAIKLNGNNNCAWGSLALADRNFTAGVKYKAGPIVGSTPIADWTAGTNQIVAGETCLWLIGKHASDTFDFFEIGTMTEVGAAFVMGAGTERYQCHRNVVITENTRLVAAYYKRGVGDSTNPDSMLSIFRDDGTNYVFVGSSDDEGTTNSGGGGSKTQSHYVKFGSLACLTGDFISEYEYVGGYDAATVAAKTQAHVKARYNTIDSRVVANTLKTAWTAGDNSALWNGILICERDYPSAGGPAMLMGG